MTLTFIQLAPFVEDCRRLGLTDDDLQELERQIAANPEAGRLVPGTGGLRKVRFARAGSGRGKRGGLRVGYTFFRFADSVYLITAYGKNEKADLSAHERKIIQALLRRVEVQLRESKT